MNTPSIARQWQARFSVFDVEFGECQIYPILRHMPTCVLHRHRQREPAPAQPWGDINEMRYPGFTGEETIARVSCQSATQCRSLGRNRTIWTVQLSAAACSSYPNMSREAIARSAKATTGIAILHGTLSKRVGGGICGASLTTQNLSDRKPYNSPEPPAKSQSNLSAIVANNSTSLPCRRSAHQSSPVRNIPNLHLPEHSCT